jgi:hypothetical protein
MTTPATPPGWYPDPSGQPGQRYFDGLRWTRHFAPHAPAAPATAVAVAVANAGGGGFGGSVHVLHAMLTFLSCGLYLPIWIICIIIDAVSASKRRSATAVSLGGAPVYPSPVQPDYGPHRPIQIPQAPTAAPVNSGKVVAIVLGAVVGVFFGLVLLGLCVEHPWLLIVMTPGSIAAAMLFWRHRNNKLQVFERYRRDVVAHRADTENKLSQEGDPRGTYGDFPPPADLK